MNYMLIALIALVAAWLVLNAGLLAAVALAHRAGQRKTTHVATPRRVVAVAPAIRA